MRKAMTAIGTRDEDPCKQVLIVDAGEVLSKQQKNHQEKN